MRFTVLAATLALALALALAPAPGLAEDFLRKSSPHSVAETVERLENAIEEGGASVIAKIDHGAAAAKAGMELRPTTLIVFGNPLMGTPLMQRAQSMALALPLRIAVYEDADGQTVLLYQDIQQIAQEHGLQDQLESLQDAILRLEALTDKAVRDG